MNRIFASSRKNRGACIAALADVASELSEDPVALLADTLALMAVEVSEPLPQVQDRLAESHEVFEATKPLTDGPAGRA